MAQEIGIVKIVTGTVTAIAADGSKRILQVGDRVYPTDLLTTADGSTVMIQLANGSLVDMGGNDSMQLGAAMQEQGETSQTAQSQQPTGLSTEDIQAALLAGADPTAIAEATSAGGAPAAGGAPGAGNEGHVPVTVEYLNPVAPVTNGFDTTGPNVAFPPIVPEVLILNPGQAAVTSGNLAPIAGNDSIAGLTPGSSVTINVLGNDSDPDGTLNPASVQIAGSSGPGQSLTVPGQGIWSVNTTTGAITFTPVSDFTGNPTPISYTVADDQGLPSNPATVTVAYNQPPVARDDSQLGNTQGNAVTINVLGNDTDPDSQIDLTSVRIQTQNGPSLSLTVANEGTWTVDAPTGAITFTPDAGFQGNPTPIEYTVADTQGLVSNIATVEIGYLPVAAATAVIVDESEAGPGVLPTEAGTLSINGQTPASVTLSASGASWNSNLQTLHADDDSYQVVVNNGTYTFTQLHALSHVNTGAAESPAIDFTFSAVLTDQNGGSATTTFTASVFDDGPTVINSNGSIKDVAGQTLTGLIDYDLGFDGFGVPATGGVTLVNNNGPLTSLSDSISYLIVDSNGDHLQELYAFVDNGALTTTFADLAADRLVFSLLPTVNSAVDGAYKLELHDVLDLPAAPSTALDFGSATLAFGAGKVAVGNSLLVEGSNLFIDSTNNNVGVGDRFLDTSEVITYRFGSVGGFDITSPQLVNSVQLNEADVGSALDVFTWTAYRGLSQVDTGTVVSGAPAGGGLTSPIDVVGGYDRLEIQVNFGKLAVGGLQYSSVAPQNLQLNFGFSATDGDGDSTGVGNFTVDTGLLLNTGVSGVAADLQHPDSFVH